jgi:hypothetical protein
MGDSGGCSRRESGLTRGGRASIGGRFDFGGSMATTNTWHTLAEWNAEWRTVDTLRAAGMIQDAIGRARFLVTYMPAGAVVPLSVGKLLPYLGEV